MRLSAMLVVLATAAPSHAQDAPRTVRRDEFFLHIRTMNHPLAMPDPALRDLPVALHVRRVSPVCAGGPCAGPVRAVVLAHGGSSDPRSAFDLPYQDYSLMEALARAGFDTFAMAHLGFGDSDRLTLDDPCNVTFGAERELLGDLVAGCPATYPSPYFFATALEQRHELDALVDHVIEEVGAGEVHLFGWSAGGPNVAVYTVEHPEKVTSVLFLSSTYGRTGPALPAAIPPSNPLTVRDFTEDARAGFACVGGACCPGQADPAIEEVIRKQHRLADPTGMTWVPRGVYRVARVARFGFNTAITFNFPRPAMVIAGDIDAVVLRERDDLLYQDLGVNSGAQKLYVTLQCMSHASLWERQAHHVIQDAAIEWFSSRTWQGNASGRYSVAQDGTVTPVP